MNFSHVSVFTLHTCDNKAMPNNFFRFSSPPAPMKYKQIKKIGMEGFSEKSSTPIFLFAYKRKKGLKKAEHFWWSFLCQHI